MRKLKDIIFEMQDEANKAFNQNKNEGLKGYGYGAIVVLNCLIENKMLRDYDIMIDESENKYKISEDVNE